VSVSVMVFLNCHSYQIRLMKRYWKLFSYSLTGERRAGGVEEELKEKVVVVGDID
jgi:hypothetical protein